MKRDFLRLSDLTPAETQELFARSRELKARRKSGRTENSLAGKTLLLLFEKASTRTRVSFEAAMFQLGGSAITLPMAESQISRGETIADTAQVISRYCDAIMFRTFGDDRLAELARAATVPVINGLSDGAHPVQLLADLLTLIERFGSLEGKVVTFMGDGASNMARSWVEAAVLHHFTLRIAAPPGYRPPKEELANAGARVQIFDAAAPAVEGAHCIATDVWTSMGQEAEAQRRRRELADFQVNEALLGRAPAQCVVLHCLPAHRGEEITDGVMQSPQSAIFDEAENRLHVQKALLEKLILQ